MKLFSLIHLFFVILFSPFIIQNVTCVAVMSVDLGSEWMKVAIVSPGVPMEIILNTDSQRKTPLVVAFRDGERYIGDSALNVGIRFPEKTFTHFIDLLGKNRIDSIAVRKYLERFPYHKIVENEKDQTIEFVIKDQDQELRFTPEELLAMMLTKARHYAEVASSSSSPTGQAQIITDCVLTVPPYFSQTERKAIRHAAQLAGLKVLQLINVNSAFALNYGIFRRKDFNTTNPTNILFYDMGAGSTLATISSYRLVKTKERGFTETDPQLTIRGVAYDRYLGGFELQLRLRDHLVKLFAEQSKKTVDEIRKNHRAMAKLLKEAGRLKKVLSANQEHKAQVENVMNDIDLKAMVTREQFETLASDLLNERVMKPLEEVFKNAGMTLDEIDSFIIIGGSTRVPKIQQQLESYWSRELSKNINADEAGALGAAYQAAYLSKGFKVKTFHLKDWNQYQINVDFERENDTDKKDKKVVSRTLFARGNTFPQKKVITFNKNRNDFEFKVNYVEPNIPQDSKSNIMKVSLTNVAEIFDKYTLNSSVEPKGIKVHFRMDESGILKLESSEASFEVEYEEIIEKDNYEQISNLVGDAISKFGSKLSSLFSGNENLSANETENVNGTESKPEHEETFKANTTNDSGSEAKILNTTESNLNNFTDTTNSTGNKNESLNATLEMIQNVTEKSFQKEIKKKIVKEEIITNVEQFDGDFQLSTETISASQKKLDTLNEKEKDKLKRDQMKNALESFIHETRDKLNQDDYSQSVTNDERESIEKELSAVSEWLDYESDSEQALAFEEKLTKLTGQTKDLFERVREHRDRPEALSSLKNMLDIADMFHTNAMNVSKDEQIFTGVELSTLRKLIDDTKTWMDEQVREQDLLPRTANPSLTIRILVEKTMIVDREVKYLLNKARITPPKKKPTTTTTTDSNEETEKNNTESNNEKNDTIINDEKILKDSMDEKTNTNSDEKISEESNTIVDNDEQIKPDRTDTDSGHSSKTEL
ncbi:hypoxia up-regulated Grp170 co-chaperone protein [Dermatophagoides pteronyssinus]|uniref:hypoxia up-regulated Grp170 co-chaperone protein n=1 Tax=Dermatophagoides pteronyssinus TaxID=6956 RepID=UPI003F6666BD